MGGRKPICPVRLDEKILRFKYAIEQEFGNGLQIDYKKINLQKIDLDYLWEAAVMETPGHLDPVTNPSRAGVFIKPRQVFCVLATEMGYSGAFLKERYDVDHGTLSFYKKTNKKELETKYKTTTYLYYKIKANYEILKLKKNGKFKGNISENPAIQTNPKPIYDFASYKWVNDLSDQPDQLSGRLAENEVGGMDTG